MRRTVQKTLATSPYMGSFPEWLTGGSKQSRQIPQQSRARYVAKKVAQKSRRPCLIQPDYYGLLRLARFPKFESRKIRGQQNNLSDGRSSPY